MLMKRHERTVYSTGISFRFPNSSADTEHIYWAPELTYSVRKRVRLRYHPEDYNTVMVYAAATDQYICEAWIMGQPDSRYTIADIGQARNDFRKGLQERMKAYMGDIQRLDRNRNASAEWDGAGPLAENEG